MIAFLLLFTFGPVFSAKIRSSRYFLRNCNVNQLPISYRGGGRRHTCLCFHLDSEKIRIFLILVLESAIHAIAAEAAAAAEAAIATTRE